MTGAPATIRRAVAGDVPALHRMLGALFGEIGYADAFQADEAALRRDGFGEAPLFRAIVAEDGETPLGLAVYFPEYSTLRGRSGVFVQDLYVAPEARSHGLARRLLAAALRDAADWGAAYMRLTVHGSNAAARRFYDRLGFVSDPEERPLSLDGAAFARLKEGP